MVTLWHLKGKKYLKYNYSCYLGQYGGVYDAGKGE